LIKSHKKTIPSGGGKSPAESERRTMKHAKSILNAITNAALLLLGFDCKPRREGVDAALLDLSGQGRDKYGN